MRSRGLSMRELLVIINVLSINTPGKLSGVYGPLGRSASRTRFSANLNKKPLGVSVGSYTVSRPCPNSLHLFKRCEFYAIANLLISGSLLCMKSIREAKKSAKRECTTNAYLAGHSDVKISSRFAGSNHKLPTSPCSFSTSSYQDHEFS